MVVICECESYFRFYKGPILIPFGFGLSYTSFEYSNLELSNTTIGACDVLQLSADVMNTGLCEHFAIDGVRCDVIRA